MPLSRRARWRPDASAHSRPYRTRLPTVSLGLSITTHAARGRPVTFIQTIEFKTKRIDQLKEALEEWLEATNGKRAATRGLMAEDRDSADTYLMIVEFASYDEAMANSKLPETSRYAEKFESLCDGQPTFRNLDVVHQEQM